jgi:hypothetical protein
MPDQMYHDVPDVRTAGNAVNLLVMSMNMGQWTSSGRRNSEPARPYPCHQVSFFLALCLPNYDEDAHHHLQSVGSADDRAPNSWHGVCGSRKSKPRNVN